MSVYRTDSKPVRKLSPRYIIIRWTVVMWIIIGIMWFAGLMIPTRVTQCINGFFALLQAVLFYLPVWFERKYGTDLYGKNRE